MTDSEIVIESSTSSAPSWALAASRHVSNHA